MSSIFFFGWGEDSPTSLLQWDRYKSFLCESFGIHSIDTFSPLDLKKH
jgi:hypothetical protein